MPFTRVEEQVRGSVEWLRLLVETFGAMVIAVGLVMAIIGLLHHIKNVKTGGFNSVRLLFAGYLTLALEMQLAADILSTSIAPTWDRIGKLAAIAIIRTALNYFLTQEMKHERAAGPTEHDDAPKTWGRPATKEDARWNRVSVSSEYA